MRAGGRFNQDLFLTTQRPKIFNIADNGLERDIVVVSWYIYEKDNKKYVRFVTEDKIFYVTGEYRIVNLLEAAICYRMEKVIIPKETK